eukprot:69941-Hanusia_phi.AAC.2
MPLSRRARRRARKLRAYADIIAEICHTISPTPMRVKGGKMVEHRAKTGLRRQYPPMKDPVKRPRDVLETSKSSPILGSTPLTNLRARAVNRLAELNCCDNSKFGMRRAGRWGEYTLSS